MRVFIRDAAGRSKKRVRVHCGLMMRKTIVVADDTSSDADAIAEDPPSDYDAALFRPRMRRLLGTTGLSCLAFFPWKARSQS